MGQRRAAWAIVRIADNSQPFRDGSDRVIAGGSRLRLNRRLVAQHDMRQEFVAQCANG